MRGSLVAVGALVSDARRVDLADLDDCSWLIAARMHPAVLNGHAPTFKPTNSPLLRPLRERLLAMLGCNTWWGGFKRRLDRWCL